MIVRESSMIFLTYPVAFEPEEVPFALREHAQDPEAIWRPKELAQDGWLPSVAEHFRYAGEGTGQASLWEVNRRSLQSVAGVGAGSETEWLLAVGVLQIPFQLEEVQLAIFPQGVAMLSLRVRPVSDEVSAWIDLLHHARYARRSRTILRVRRRVGFDPDTGNAQWRDYFPTVAGGLAEHPEGQGQLGDLLDGFLRSTTRNSQVARWWKEVFVPGQLIPFAALFLDQVPPLEREAILYRVQNFFSSEEGLPFASSEVQDHGHRWMYAKNQTFLFALDGTAFVAFDAPQTPFFQSTFPGHLSRQYWFLFQLALYQRFSLIRMTEQVSQGWNPIRPASDDRNERLLNRTRNQLLTFAAGGYFAQVAQQPRQHACYRRWQECFQIPELYARTRQALDDMQAYVSRQRDERLRFEFRRIDLRLRQIALLLGPPALALSFISIVGWTSPAAASGALIGGLLLGWALCHVPLRSVDRKLKARKEQPS